MSDIALKTRQLSKRFNINKANEVTPVYPLDLEVRENICVVLKGPSGSGKTTLLTMLSCLTKPTSGEYECLGQKVSRWSEKFLTHFRRQHIGIVFQHFNLIHGLNTALNIALPLLPQAFARREITQKVEKVAEQVNISHRLNFNVDQLSGGELQRVAIARALVNQPALLFADEPTAHLDSAMSRNILDILSGLKSQGTTLIITTHDPLVEQHPMVDEIWLMQDGRLKIEMS